MDLPSGTDAARALRLVDRFVDVIRYVPEWKSWIVFEDGRWRTRDTGALMRLAGILAREIMGEARSLMDGPGDVSLKETLNRIHKEASAFANASAIESMAAFARADSRIIASPHEIDSDPWLIGAPNGVVNLRDGRLLPHSREKIITKCLGAPIDDAAKCVYWECFLQQVIPDASVRKYLQRAVGYSLTGLTSEHFLTFLYGIGSNGKSTFLEALFNAFGDYAGRAAESLLYANERNVTPPDVIAEIHGVRFLVGSETQEGARLNESTIKDITGGDTLRGCRKYQHGFVFRPVCKLWMVGNHKPAIRGNDDGIWRRVSLIGFPVQIPPEGRDKDLPIRLREELPGILNWAIDGCILWQAEGLNPPDCVVSAVAEYRSDEDTLGEFITERTEGFQVASVPHAVLYNSYLDWTKQSGIRHPLSTRTLAKRLRERGWVDGRATGGATAWMGVRLRSERSE